MHRKLQRLLMERGPVPSTQSNLAETGGALRRDRQPSQLRRTPQFSYKDHQTALEPTQFSTPASTAGTANARRHQCLKRKVDLDLRLARSRRAGKRSVRANQAPCLCRAGPQSRATALNFAQEIRAQIAWRNEVWVPLLDELVTSGFLLPKWLENVSDSPASDGDLPAEQARFAPKRQAEIVRGPSRRLLEKDWRRN